MINRILISLAIFTFGASVTAQELQVKVTINTPKLQTADPAVFGTLKTSIEEFMNNQKWTNEVVEQEERIKMDIVMTISKELSATSFEAEFSLQATRPVYGSTYESPMLKHQDKDVVFTYQQFQPLEYSQTVFMDNLTSVLAFYAYMTLGMDFDSFSPFGGETYFQMAQDVVNRIPPSIASSAPGWRSVEGSRNRYWLVESLLAPRSRAFRQAIYDYHRQGLDVMHLDVATGRAKMTGAIETLSDVNRNYPNAMILQVFANTKSDEIIEIYKGATPLEKDRVIKTMEKVNPPRASTFRQGIGK
jgi:hypothetical protein